MVRSSDLRAHTCWDSGLDEAPRAAVEGEGGLVRWGAGCPWPGSTGAPRVGLQGAGDGEEMPVVEQLLFARPL